MNLYKVIFNQQHADESVIADDWQKMEDQYVFYRDGKATAFFDVSAVHTIKVENENYDPNAWAKFARKMNVPTTYGVEE